MTTEEDNFDIDIYGDGGEDYQQDESHMNTQDKSEPSAKTNGDSLHTSEPEHLSANRSLPETNGQADVKIENEDLEEKAQKIASTDESTQNPVQLPKQAPQTQGLKRQDGADDRFVEPGATTALMISELHWWVTDDDIRGWANQSECEDELEDMTFSEHKVNGKSKGQAYILFKSPQAATAAKIKIESFGEGQQYAKRFTVSYTNPYTNPFRTLPKDGPMRNANNNRSSAYQGGAGNNAAHSSYNANSSGSGYRGNRGGGYNSRGNGYNRGGYQQPMGGGFQGPQTTGFQGMGGMQAYGGFQNRGGMMGGMRGGGVGMRGGRGGMASNGMMAMPMGGMGLGAMGAQMGGLGMGMPQVGTGMGMQGMQSSQTYPLPPASGQHSYIGEAVAAPGLGAYTSTSAHSPGPSYTGYVQSPAGGQMSHFPYASSGLSTAASPDLNQPNGGLTANSANPGQGFQGSQAHYNPAFFSQQQQGQTAGGVGDASWNPHGAKRTRQE